MRKSIVLFLCFLVFLLTACGSSAPSPEMTVPESTAATVPSTTAPPVTVSTEPETVPTSPEPVMELTEKEKTMLLKIGMAERGEEGCTECIALVMRTVLNRVETGRFGDNIGEVIFAPGQFTPVTDGSYYYAQPNEQCYEALDMVIYGWDESQGALAYEWCEGASWHSKNLDLLFQHCNVRFYN